MSHHLNTTRQTFLVTLLLLCFTGQLFASTLLLCPTEKPSNDATTSIESSTVAAQPDCHSHESTKTKPNHSNNNDCQPGCNCCSIVAAMLVIPLQTSTSLPIDHNQNYSPSETLIQQSSSLFRPPIIS